MKTSEMRIELVNSMGDDLTIVNAARASFNKESQWEVEPTVTFEPREGDDLAWPVVETEGRLKESDARLIRFLANGLTVGEMQGMLVELVTATSIDEARALFHRIRRLQSHFAPFGHVQLSFKIKAPLFVARQLWKSHVGACGGDAGLGSWSEESRRYVREEPEFYWPVGGWRARAESAKQGSAGLLDAGQQSIATDAAFRATNQSREAYVELSAMGTAPEMARMLLTQNVLTTWVWTGSLLFFARVCTLRLDAHAQAETREVAEAIALRARPIAPVSWAALMGEAV